MYRIIDTPWNAAGHAEALRATGIETVIRYYNFANSRTLPEKALTLAEAQALCGAGLRIGVVFQQRQNQERDFSHEQGLRAGRRAFELARQAIGQPPGSAIYFAVDFDADAAAVERAVMPYFEGVHAAFEDTGGRAAGYRLGCYGSGLVVRLLRDAGLIECVWLSMSRGFRETGQRLEEGDWHLNQVPPAQSLLGLGIDFNEANPDGRDIGDFVIADDEGAALGSVYMGLASATVQRYRVNARSGLRLRAGPGIEFDVLDNLPLGTIVTVVETKGDWAKIDRNGDGLIDGFAHREFLQSV
jgi:hypothetical protein